MLKNIFKGSNGLRGLAPADVCRPGRRRKATGSRRTACLIASALMGAANTMTPGWIVLGLTTVTHFQLSLFDFFWARL
jgi:hypothetical protein